MQKLTSMVAALSLAVGVAACQQDNKETEARLERMEKKIDALAQAVEKMPAAAARGAQPPARGRRPEPAPTDVFAVPVDGNPSEGPADALVTIVKGYEYACPFCQKVKPTLEQLHKDYGDKVRVVYKQFVVHPQTATEPALAVCAAHQQGKFLEMDKIMWTKAFEVRKFDRANMEALAGELKLDLAKFKADMDGMCKDYIKNDQVALQQMGQGATPTFFINGRYMSGAQPLPAFKAIVDEEIKKAEERIAKGTARGDYYKTWVLDKGLKKFNPPAEK